MNASDDGTGQRPLLRERPDTTRPAVSTAVAAARRHQSRYYIAELVRQGKLDGYGVRRRDGGRIRWYVYEDALPPAAEDTEAVRASAETRELLRHLRDVRKYSILARDELDGAHRKLLDAVDQLVNAVDAARTGELVLMVNLLLEAQRARDDEARRRLVARKYEAAAEKSLEAALWGLSPLGEEIESHGKDATNISGSGDSTALEMPESSDSG